MYLNRENDTCYFFGKHVFHKNVKNVIKSLLLGVTVIPSLKGRCATSHPGRCPIAIGEIYLYHMICKSGRYTQ